MVNKYFDKTKFTKKEFRKIRIIQLLLYGGGILFIYNLIKYISGNHNVSFWVNFWGILTFIGGISANYRTYKKYSEELKKANVRKTEEMEKERKKWQEDLEVNYEMSKIQDRMRRRELREEAERRIYGNVKRKRISLTEEEKDNIFDKFNNECSVCGRTEGLHIHHKDENPSNNRINNLTVLCGVCHKKIHMKVR